MIEHIPIYDPQAIRAGLGLAADPTDENWGEDAIFKGIEDPAYEASFSSDEQQWRRSLRRIADDPRGPLRPALVGTTEMAKAVESLDEVAPHFKSATRIVRRAVVASARTGSRVRFPPICLLGPPGIGKTYYARRCALALDGLHFIEIPLNMLNDRGRLSGYSMTWKGARIGDLAMGLLAQENTVSGPLFLLDEIDKASSRERLHDILISALEPENARKFVDEYLTAVAPLRLDHAHFITTANDLAGIPEPLLDRMLVIDVGLPSGDELRSVIFSIYQAATLMFGPTFDPFVSLAVVRRLESMSPRAMKRVLDLAIPVALENGRRSLNVGDIEDAAGTALRRRQRQVGFLG